MSDVRIYCITKSHPNGGHEHITHVGNPGSWYWDVERVIASIDANTNAFFVLDPTTGRRADVGVVRAAGKRPHIRTYADGYYNDNLLALVFCPYRAAA